MTSGLQPELLNEKQKRWLATAICGAVTADAVSYTHLTLPTT